MSKILMILQNTACEFLWFTFIFAIFLMLVVLVAVFWVKKECPSCRGRNRIDAGKCSHCGRTLKRDMSYGHEIKTSKKGKS